MEKKKNRVERTDLQSGYSISRLIKGGWHLAGGHGEIDPDQAVKDMAAFVEAGITTFDCADHYTGVEELIGNFRKAYPSLASQVKIHTKFVPDYEQLGNVDRTYVEKIIDRSLKRLHVERLDLVQFYWWDPDGIPGYIDTALLLGDLKTEGKIDRLGVSNFNTRQLRTLIDTGVPMESNQPQYSLLDTRPEKKLIPYCLDNGINQLCYGTLAGGFFSEDWMGKPEPTELFANRSLTKYKLIIDDFGGWTLFQELLQILKQVSDRYGVTMPLVAMRWVLDRPGVAALIIGATSTRHLEENLRVFDFSMTDDDYDLIDTILKKSTILNGDCYDLERDKTGHHGSIMRYNQNKTE